MQSTVQNCTTFVVNIIVNYSINGDKQNQYLQT